MDGTVVAGEALDGGWGWCIVLGTTVCSMILATQGPCFGILYGSRLRELGASPTLTAWLFNFQSLVWNLAGPCAGPLSERFSYRAVAVTSALMAVSSLFFSAVATTPYLLLLTFSVLSGVGGGININCCYQLTAQYFNKKLGVANGLTVAGASVGFLLLPLLASHLQELYPFQWATFITGAVMLHAAVGALLFHPLSWHLKRPKYCGQVTHTAAGHSPGKSQPQMLPHKSDSSIEVLSCRLARSSSVPQGQLGQTSDDTLPTAASSELNSATGNSEDTKQVTANPMSRGTKMVSVLPPPGEKQLVVKPSDKKVEERVGLWTKVRTHTNMAVLRDPYAVSVALVTCLSITAAINVFATMPFVLNDAGYSLKESAWAMSVAAVVDLATRLLGATITDLPYINPRYFYSVGQLVFIVFPYVLSCAWGRWWVVLGCMAAFGMGLAILFVMDVLLIVRLLGVHKFRSVFGISQLFRCIAFTVLGPVGGALREATGSYVATLAFFSCMMLSGLLLMTAASARCARPAPTLPR